MLQNLSPAAVVIGALRVKVVDWDVKHQLKTNPTNTHWFQQTTFTTLIATCMSSVVAIQVNFYVILGVRKKNR